MSTSTPKTAPHKPVAKKRRFSFGGIVKYFKEVVAELKRVSWPSRKDLISYTIAVVIFVVVMGLIIGGLDMGFAQIFKAIIG